MKRVALSLLSSICFTCLFGYITHVLSPWDKEAVLKIIAQYNLLTSKDFLTFIDEIIQLGLIWELLNIKNLLLWFLLFGVSFTTTFATLHLLIDKLFFKKYHELPDLFNAYRRGILLYLLFCGLIVLRLLSGLVWYNVLLLLLLLLSIEYLIHTYYQNIQKKFLITNN